MKIPVKLLLLEDSEPDELLLIDELVNGGYEPSIERVWTKERMEEALTHGPWDIIISDFAMPCFDALDGLSVLKQSGLDIPFLLVSGTIGEERAVSLMKAGASDYIAKGNLARLLPVMARELADAKERRRTEQALAASESNFRTLVENSVAGIYVIQDERLAYVNPTVIQILGYSAEELASRPLVDFVCEEDREVVSNNIRKRMVGAIKSVHYTLRLKRKDGTIAHVEAHGARTDYHGRPSILGILTDITERKRAEERFTTIFRSSPVGIALSTLAGSKMVEVNDAFLGMVGFSREEVIGFPATQLGLWVNPEERSNLMRKLLDQGSVKNLETAFRRKSGDVIVTLASFEVLELNDEKCILAFFHDITEKKRMENQLLRNQRMESLGSLAGGIAHDLNNALAPILMSVGLLRMNVEGSENQKMLDMAQASAQRGTEMVKQILMFARGVEGKHETVQLKDLLKDMLTLVQQTFPKSIQIKEQIAKELWPVSGNTTQLHQVLLNLCVNARDAMPEGGTLTLAAENLRLDEHCARIHQDGRAGPHVALSVIDTGTGIPQHIQERIFEPFFTTKEPGKGTGLGLSTVQNIIKNHDGFLTLDSAGGKGTEFKVYLPVNVSAPVAISSGERPSLPAGNGEWILVVDDESIIRDIARQTLETYGYHVLVAQDGAEAVHIYEKNMDNIRLVLTDIIMPVMDGAAAIEAIRSIDPGVKIIVASAQISETKSRSFDPSIAQAVLQKPYTLEMLLHTIHKVLDPKQCPCN